MVDKDRFVHVVNQYKVGVFNAMFFITKSEEPRHFHLPPNSNFIYTALAVNFQAYLRKFGTSYTKNWANQIHTTLNNSECTAIYV